MSTWVVMWEEGNQCIDPETNRYFTCEGRAIEWSKENLDVNTYCIIPIDD